MSSFDTEDLKTEIDTIFDKPDNPMDDTSKEISSQNTLDKTILSSPSSSSKEVEVKKEVSFSNQSFQYDIIPRPHTLEEFVQKDKVTEIGNEKPSFSLDDLDEDEEIYIVDIPKTIDPIQLKGQVFHLGDKSKFKVGEERYCAINRESKSSLTCVFSANENLKYEAVNIKPTGTISIRRKLSATSKKNIEYERTEAVPFPKNLKLRHPLFGVQIEPAVKCKERG